MHGGWGWRAPGGCRGSSRDIIRAWPCRLQPKVSRDSAGSGLSGDKERQRMTSDVVRRESERQRGMVMSSTNDGRLLPPSPGRKLSLGQRQPATFYTAVSFSFIPSALTCSLSAADMWRVPISTPPQYPHHAEGSIPASG